VKTKQSLSSIIILSLFLILSLTPFIDTHLLGLYNEKRGFQAVALVLSLILIPKLSINKKYYIIFFLLILFASLSVIYSGNKLQSILNFLHFIMLIFFINLGFNLKAHINKLFFLLLFSNLFVVSYSLLNYLFYFIDSLPALPDGVLYGFYNIRFFNQYQVLCLPIIFYFLQNKKLSRVASTLLVLNLFLFLISGARGALLSCLIIITLGGYFKVLDRAVFVKIFKCCLVSLALFYLHIQLNTSTESVNYLTRVDSSGRVDIWQDLLSQLNIFNLIIGNGPGVYFMQNMALSHPHNSLLQFLYNWGGVVTLIITFFLFKLFKSCTFYIKHNNSEPEFNFCFLALYGLLAYSFVSGVIVMPIPQTFIFIFIGLTLSYLPLNLTTTNNSAIKSIGCYLLSAFYLFFVIMSYNCLDSSPYGPSFWSNGQLSFSECKLPYKEN
jgi:hypothetical protein